MLLLGALLAAALDTRTPLNGPLLPEGSDWNSEGVAILEDTGAFVTLPFLRTIEARGLVVQADFDDTYFVESSEDGAVWRVVWRVPALPAPPGLRSRWIALANPESFRFLRVRATSGNGLYSVARVHVYESLPSPWPPRFDLSLPGRGTPLFPALTPARVAALRTAAAAAGVLSALIFALARTAGGARWRRVSRVGLIGAALLAALSWTNFLNFHFRGFVHHHELFHYYIGAKYFAELGYDGLYECVLLADRDEGGPAVEGRPLRDLRTDTVVTATEAALEPPCRRAFTTERWSALRRDVSFFRSRLGGDWPAVFLDHGFNGTPAWTYTSGLLAQLLPATSLSVRCLALLDLGLLVVAALILAQAFSLEAACLAVIFFGTNAFARFAWTGGAFLRYDWLLLALSGVAAAKTNRPKLAGFVLMWSTLLRIFPGVLLLGFALKTAVDALFEGRRGAWSRLKPVALGATLATLTIVPASSLLAGRPGAWREFSRNSVKYVSTEAENKLGLMTALSFRPQHQMERLQDPLRPDPLEDWARTRAEAARRLLPLRVLLVLTFVALFCIAARRLPAWSAAALGAGFLPVLFQQGNYYYALLAVYALLVDLAPGVGLGLALLAWSSDLASLLWPAWEPRAAALSALACGFAYWVTWRMARVSP